MKFNFQLISINFYLQVYIRYILVGTYTRGPKNGQKPPPASTTRFDLGLSVGKRYVSEKFQYTKYAQKIKLFESKPS